MSTEYPDHRDNLGKWLNDHGLVGAGVEIGCAFGGFSRIILATWKGSKHYMVDPWCKQDPTIYREKTDDVQYDQWFLDCSRLASEDSRVELIRKFSVDAAKQFTEGILDFVFIDGNHSYRAVLDDMDAWYPKVKAGGLFSGHDCYNDITYPSHCEVKRAVERWSSEHSIPFVSTPCSSWWMIKPK